MDQEEAISSIKKLNIKEHDLVVVNVSSSYATHDRMRHLLSVLRNTIKANNPILFLYGKESIKTIDRDKAVKILKGLLNLEKKDILNEILK